MMFKIFSAGLLPDARKTGLIANPRASAKGVGHFGKCFSDALLRKRDTPAGVSPKSLNAICPEGRAPASPHCGPLAEQKQGLAGARPSDRSFGQHAPATGPTLSPRPMLGLWWLSLFLLALAGCQTVRPLPPVNLKSPGWTVRQGQAVWKLPQGSREIAGDVLVATSADGRGYVQFSVSPFTFVIAQESPEQWEVEFPPQNKHYSGRGAPPKRVIWLYLPRVLSGQPPPKNWTWRQDSNGWRLENHSTGESLEGFFTQ